MQTLECYSKPYFEPYKQSCTYRDLQTRLYTVTVKRFEKFSLKFSISLFIIRFNFLHPLPSRVLYGLLLSLWCFTIFVRYYFWVSFAPASRTTFSALQRAVNEKALRAKSLCKWIVRILMTLLMMISETNDTANNSCYVNLNLL